jgi:hypothetical protein
MLKHSFLIGYHLLKNGLKKDEYRIYFSKYLNNDLSESPDP